MGVTQEPLGDINTFVQKLRTTTPAAATGLSRHPAQGMIALAGEIADGMVFANGARSHMADSLSALPAAKRQGAGFFIGNMIPTCISDDVEAAKAVNRKTLTHYALLPNYRNYWKEAGYVEEMTAIEKALAEGRGDDVPKYLTDKWLTDNTLFGPPARARGPRGPWYAAGVRCSIVVPSLGCRQPDEAIEEMFARLHGAVSGDGRQTFSTEVLLPLGEVTRGRMRGLPPADPPSPVRNDQRPRRQANPG
jgi:hypothetical protein